MQVIVVQNYQRFASVNYPTNLQMFGEGHQPNRKNLIISLMHYILVSLVCSLFTEIKTEMHYKIIFYAARCHHNAKKPYK